MSEIYWITRLDSINTISLICVIVGVIISGIAAVIYYAANGQRIYDDSHGYESSARENEGYANTCKGILIWSVPVSIIFSLLMIFIPTTKQGFLIYGLGGTVDYIKQNPTARQLPDKCIKALDKWVESWSIEKKNKDENEKMKTSE